MPPHRTVHRDQRSSLRDAIRPFEMADCVPVMRELRFIKSRAEVAHIRHICGVAGDAFDNLPSLLALGDTEREICRKFAADLLLRGADKVPYTSIGTGKGGYTSIIMGPTNRRLRKGDVILIDTGSKYAGYYCDFDRNFSIGEPSDDVKHAQEILWQATEAGIEAAVPGNTAADVFFAQARVLERGSIAIGNVGRFGHGLGKVMTEFPSNKPIDRTVLRPGMVLTIEPSAMFGNGKISRSRGKPGCDGRQCEAAHPPGAARDADSPPLLRSRGGPTTEGFQTLFCVKGGWHRTCPST